jgi:putative SOS response-associated peptidase YedK
MCGRYYIASDDVELADIVAAVRGSDDDLFSLKISGEVFPMDIVPAIIASGQYRAMRWGFTGFGGASGKPIINARSETALEKPIFRSAMLERRCLIPASSYFEWRKDGNRKTKFEFRLPKSSLLLAGCWREEKDGAVFVILTRDAVNGCEEIHERMPVIIPRERADDWFSGNFELMKNSETRLIFEVAQ